MLINSLKLEQLEAKQFIALQSPDMLIYEFDGQIVTIPKNVPLLKALISATTAKSLSLAQLEARENAFISLVQHGQLDEIQARLADQPELSNKVTRFGKFAANTPLYIAVAMKRHRIAQLLIEHQSLLNVKCTRDKETPLHRATRHQDIQMVRILLQAGASRKIKDRHGLRPVDVVKRLYREARDKETKVRLRELVVELQIVNTGVTSSDKENQVDTEQKDLSGLLSNTSLEAKPIVQDMSLAINSGDVASVSVYLCAGGDPNYVNQRGHSLMQCAFAAKNETIVEMLLKKSADPNRPFSHGSLPLHRACVCRLANIVHMLLQHGANPAALDNKGRSALDRLGTVKLKKAHDKKIQRMREQFKVIRKMIEARLEELNQGDISLDLDKITLTDPDNHPRIDTLKLD